MCKTLKNVIKICAYNRTKKRFETRYITLLIKILFEFTLFFLILKLSHKNEFISIQGSGACWRIFFGLQVDGAISGVCVRARACVCGGVISWWGGGGGFKAGVCDINGRY